MHVEDALIGETALAKANVLVTKDKTFAPRMKAIQSPLRVLGGEEFVKFLEGIAGSQ